MERWEVLNYIGKEIHISDEGSILVDGLKPKVFYQQGYNRFTLRNGARKKNLMVHRLVAEAFIPNPDNKATVNHIDCNKSNNTARNLEWATIHENIEHGFQNGLYDHLRPKRPIVAICLKTGKETFYPTMSAAERVLGTRHIDAVLSGKRKTAKGHIFKDANKGGDAICQL